MAPPRDPRKQRARARRGPDLQVAGTDSVVAVDAAPDPAPATAGSPVGNRAREQLLTRLRTRAAERRAARTDPAPDAANDDAAPALPDRDPAADAGPAQDAQSDTDDVVAVDAAPAATDSVADGAAAKAAAPAGATKLSADTRQADATAPAAPRSQDDDADTDSDTVATVAGADDASDGVATDAAVAPPADGQDLAQSDARAATPDDNATVTAVDADADSGGSGDGPTGSLDPAAGDAGDAPDPAPVKPGPALKAWHAKTVGAAKAIPQPDQPKAAAAPEKIKSTGQKIRKSRGGRRKTIPKEAAAAISEVPKKKGEIKPPAKPPPDPVPEANKLVDDTAKKKLPDVKLPNLKPSPRGSQPLIPNPNAKKPPPVPAPADVQKADAPAKPAGPGKPTPADQKATDAVTDAAAKPVPQVPPGTATGPTLKDTPPPPRKPLPAGVNNVMKQVLAQLMLNPKEQAKPIITSARKDAYPNNVLQFAYKDIGNDKLPDLAGDLKEALNLIAADAGIAGDELKAEVEKRKAAATETAKKSTDAQSKAQTTEKDALSKESGDEIAEVNAAEDAQHARTTATVQAATGEGSPQVIDARRDAQVRKINRKVGDIRFGYDRAKDRRHQALDRARAVQIRAYDKVRDDDIKAVRAAYKKDKEEGKSEGFNAFLEIGTIGNWADESKRALSTEVTNLKTAATNQTKTFRTDTFNAGRTATEQVRTWASELKGETTSWWDELWALFSDWSQQAEVEAENWSGVRASEARDATVQNMGVLSQFMRTQGEAVNLETNAAFKTLSAEQQEVIKAYYASPAGKRDAIGAVAAGLKFRLAAQQKPLMIEKMKKEVMAKPDSEWPQFDQIGAAQKPGFSAETISSRLYDAMFGGVTGWGTDEDKIYDNVTGLTKLQGRAVRANYRIDFGRNLDSDLASELDGDNALVRAKAALDGDPVIEAVGALNEAMDGIGTDEDTIMKVLRGKTAEQRARIIEEYRRRYGVDLNRELKSEMSSHDLERSQALMEGNTAKADAIALDQAMHGGFLGWGTDEKQIEDTYAAIRSDAANMQVSDGKGGMRPLTQKELEAEVARRNAQVEVEYDTKYGTPGDQKSALRAAYKSELSGPDLDLANALADNDLVAADAAKLERERQGFYTDDDVVNNVLETQYTRSLDALKRDPKWRAERDALMKKAAKLHWDPYQIAAAERALDRKMEEAAKAGAKENMAALENKYDTKYSRWGKGGLQVMIAFNMSGTDQEKARTLVEQGGHLTRAQRFEYATKGAGTDEDDAKKALTGATAAEIAEINKERARKGLPSVEKTIDSEMSGRDNFDSKMLARGVPENAKQEMDQARDKAQWELRNSPVGGKQREVLAKRMNRMEKQYKLINDPNADPFEKRRALDQFRQRGQGVQAGVDSYRAQVDAVADAAATAAALTAAIVVTVLTGGVAGAVLGALAAAAATMTVKAGLKGAAYGTDEMAIDAVVGIVDAAAAYATFGMGNALLRVATSQGGRVTRLGGTKVASTLARMAGSSSRTQRMLATGVAEAVEGAAGAMPSALAGNMLNDKNWEKGNPLTNILGGTLMETGMGAVVSGGMGSLGGIKMPKVDPPTPRTGDILAHRGTPQDRLSAWKAHKADNPDAKMGDFLKQHDQQVKDRLAAEARDAGVQRVLRGELLAGIPPRQRRAFKDVEIEVMSDADFRAFTRSDSGNAVTIIDGGQPKIILRDGAPTGVLREEGIHLQQLMDPELGPLVKRLDEGRMQDWDKLSVAEKMELYAIKVELEIDAQIRLIDGLDADIRAKRPGADLDALADQKAQAETSLNNLRKRADEVASVGPLDRIAMARGLRDPPPYLDQPARLFSKQAKPAPIDGTVEVRGSTIDIHTEAGKRPEFEMEINGIRHKFKGDADGVLQQVLPTAKALKKGDEIRGDLLITEVDPATGAITIRREPLQFKVGTKKIEVQRKYRQALVSTTDPKSGRVLTDQIEQAMHIDHKTMQQTDWGPSGRASNRKGDIAELASTRKARDKIADPTDSTQAVIDVQKPGGQGFDGVELHVGPDGVPRIRIIEVKNYNGGVPYQDFTAVNRNTASVGGKSGNLDDNLADLDKKLRPSADDIAEANKRLDAMEDLHDPIGHGPFGPVDPDAFDFEKTFDQFPGAFGGPATGPSMAERALIDQARQAVELKARAVQLDAMTKQVLAERLGITPGQLAQLRSAFDAGRFDLEIRLAGGAEIGGEKFLANMGPGALKRADWDETTLARLQADWAGTGNVLPSTKITPSEMAKAAEVFDNVKSLNFDKQLRATGDPNVQFVDKSGNMLAVKEVTNSGAQDQVQELAQSIATRMRTLTKIAPHGHGYPHMAIDLSNIAKDKSAFRREILDELDRLKPPLSKFHRNRLIFWGLD